MGERDQQAVLLLCYVLQALREVAGAEQKVNKRGSESYVWLLGEQQATTSSKSYPIISQYTLRERGGSTRFLSLSDRFFPHSPHSLRLFRPIWGVSCSRCFSHPGLVASKWRVTRGGARHPTGHINNTHTRPLGIGCVKWPGSGVAPIAKLPTEVSRVFAASGTSPSYPRRSFVLFSFFSEEGGGPPRGRA